MTHPAPLEAPETADLFSRLDRPVALAVSGGVDSMVLMHLVAVWQRRQVSSSCPPPLVLTVDHGLRPESADEARFVGSCAADLGLAHETLVWSGPRPASGIQEAARTARFALLLGRLARDPVPRDLVLAHHLDDQAETMLMRLARGSGIDGLSAMRALERRFVVIPSHPMREVAIRLQRPLLSVAKCRLQATAARLGVKWRDDPSNADSRFERVRLRQSGSALATLGLSAESLARSARRLGVERAAAVARAGDFARRHIQDHGGAFGELNVTTSRPVETADMVRLLARLLEVYGGSAPSARLSQIETLAARVSDTAAGGVDRLTLGGCLVEITGGDEGAVRLTVVREHSRQPLPITTLQPGQGIYWDRRFYISLTPDAAGPVVIGPFGACGTDSDRPRGCIAGLPAVQNGGIMTLIFGGSVEGISCRWPRQHEAQLRFLDPDEPFSYQ